MGDSPILAHLLPEASLQALITFIQGSPPCLVQWALGGRLTVVPATTTSPTNRVANGDDTDLHTEMIRMAIITQAGEGEGMKTTDHR